MNQRGVMDRSMVNRRVVDGSMVDGMMDWFGVVNGSMSEAEVPLLSVWLLVGRTLLLHHLHLLLKLQLVPLGEDNSGECQDRYEDLEILYEYCHSITVVVITFMLLSWCSSPV